MTEKPQGMPRKLTFLFLIVGFAQCLWSVWHLGAGLWGIAMGLVLVPVMASLLVPALENLGRGLCLLVGIISLVFALLLLLAATAGGSFRLPAEQAVLVAGMGSLFVLGVSIERVGGKRN